MNNISNKSKLLLSGIISVSSLGVAAQANVLTAATLHCPYGQCLDSSNMDAAFTTGLTQENLAEATNLISKLRETDILINADMTIEEAKRNPARYNFPDHEELMTKKTINQERLAKLRKLIQTVK